MFLTLECFGQTYDIECGFYVMRYMISFIYVSLYLLFILFMKKKIMWVTKINYNIYNKKIKVVINIKHDFEVTEFD